MDEMRGRGFDFTRALLFAPPVFVVHFPEEWPWFVEWFNAHVARGLVDGGYVPGLATAVLLYLPYYLLLMTKAVKSVRVRPAVLAAAAVLGSLPMLAHGYLILLRGSRLF